MPTSSTRCATSPGRPRSTRRRRGAQAEPRGALRAPEDDRLPASHRHARGVVRVSRPAMRTLGLSGVRRDKGIRTTIPAKDGTRAGDLLDRDFTAAAPNRTWVTDFTYVRTWAGFTYVAFIVDVYAQRIVAWHAATTKQTDLVMIPLRMALWQRDREGHPTIAGELISPLGCRVSIHVAAADRAPRARGDPALDRVGRRCLRQRPDGVHQRPLQGRVHPHHRLPRRPLQDHRRRRVRHRRLGRLVQQPKAPLDPGKRPTRRVRASPLRCPQPRAAPRIGTAENLGRFKLTWQR